MQVQTDPRDKKIVQMVGTGTGHVKVDIYCPKWMINLVFKYVILNICLDYLKGTGVEEFVRPPWLKVVEEVSIDECVEFIGN